MRRRPTHNDSFDLFLDTICNTFGGIIFLAILVAILIQTRSILHQPEQTNQTTHSPQESRQLLKRLAAAESSVQSLTLALDSMPQIKPTDDLREYLEQKSRHATLQENISEKISETETKSRSLESLITTNSELDTITREVPERLKSLTKLVNAEESAVSELVNTRQTSLKLPRERESSSQSTLALLKGDQLYIAGEFDGTQDKFDGPHVSTKKTLGGFRVLPDSGQGITVKNSGTDSFISSTRREGQIVTLAVWPDSFGAFAELKPKLMDSGLRYQIWIQSSGSDLIVSIGSSTSRAQ